METAPVIVLVANKLNDPADFERYSKWVMEVFFPIWSKNPEIVCYRYKILKESPDYRPALTVFRFTNYKAFLNHWQSTDGRSILNDIQTTWGSKQNYIWDYPYHLERSFYSPLFSEEYQKASRNITIHIEAFDIPHEKEGTYYSWFTDIGYDVNISRMLKRPGLIGYEHLRYIGEQNEYMDTPHFATGDLGPAYVSLFHFDTPQHCLDFSNSRELITYRSSLNPYFPEVRKVKWSVDYQLIGIWKNGKPLEEQKGY
jgi:hypothetical protein